MPAGRSMHKAYCFVFLAISLSKMSFSLISSTDERSHSTLGKGLEMKRAAMATDGSTWFCNAATSHSELSSAFDFIGSRSSVTNGSDEASPPVG
uniref:Putative secreted protein n=1 Tax=Anopheles triannulatus TaxID=58253 RepID=A0A2M4B3N4_9DIPT